MPTKETSGKKKRLSQAGVRSGLDPFWEEILEWSVAVSGPQLGGAICGAGAHVPWI